ncbi:MAG TPA: hypothetical protein ENN19_04290 [Chloroflexi bacterium]|nr:hypothetical protein [Chloroflexota bacterium]
MLTSKLKELAADYLSTLGAPAAGSDDSISKERELFTDELAAEGIVYFDPDDVDRIARGMSEGTFDLRYHQCGRAIILDSERFRIHGGKLAGHVIEDCPGCGRRLDAFDLYAEPGGATRNLLRQAGLYPTADSLVLMRDANQRATILEGLQESLRHLSDGDLLAAYAVVVALLQDSLAG